ncbi:MAG: endolytic transglycosylase MltG [Patescibacteria group bacterium]
MSTIGVAYRWAAIAALTLLVLSQIPTLAEDDVSETPAARTLQPFTVSVDPVNKIILDEPLDKIRFSSVGLVATVVTVAQDFVSSLARIVVDAPAYQLVASPSAARVVVVYPGSRREQVATAFGSVLGWSREERQVFLGSTTTDPLEEGTLHPSTYVVSPGLGPVEAHALVKDRFDRRVLSRYATSTRQIVPVDDALIIASMLERETSDPDEMRIISGIIWNRLFAGMKLQIDATLQYVRGTTANTWWPPPRSRDKYLNSPYNTYQHAGLPPGPISSPSVAAIVAALNPVPTDCYFYFHDLGGTFYCSKTYEEHVASLKKVYGRGK